MPKCDFNKVVLQRSEIAFQHGCFPLNLLHIFRTPFYKNTYGGLLLTVNINITTGMNYNYSLKQFLDVTKDILKKFSLGTCFIRNFSQKIHILISETALQR